MKDIDFDELDQAVNSLMSSTSAPTRIKKTEGRPPGIKSKASNRSPVLNSRAKDSGKRPIHTSSRSSRFMDVVDSSGELNPFKKAATPAARMSKRRVNDKSKSVSAADVHVGLRNNTATRPTNVANPVNQIKQSRVKPVINTSPAAKAKQNRADDSKAESVVVRRVGKTITPEPLNALKDTSLEVVGDDQKVIPTDSDIRPIGVFGQSKAGHDMQIPLKAKGEATESDSALVDLSKELQSQLNIVLGDQPVGATVVPPVLAQEISVEAAVPQSPPDDLPSTSGDRTTLIPISRVTAYPDPAPVVNSKNSATLAADEVQLSSDSPFVDVKIEKRPLNANVPEVAEQDLVLSVEAQQASESTDFKSTEQAESSIALKLDELSEKLTHNSEPLSDARIDDENKAEVENEATLVPELSNELIAIEATGSVSVEESDTAQVKNPPASAGPSSIAPQYQQGESSGDTTHVPIYDTTQYAEPVAHPAKKKTGWLWVVGVLVLLALGSGGAVALYLTGIIP